MVGFQQQEISDWIAVIRIAPIVIVIITSLVRRKYKPVLPMTTFMLSTISNQFLENRDLAGIFSTISAYSLAYVFAEYLLKHRLNRSIMYTNKEGHHGSSTATNHLDRGASK